MATSVPKQLITVTLGASTTNHYSVPSNRVLLITRATLLNTTSSDRTANMYLVGAGDSADATNQILKAKVLEADMQQPYVVSGAERQILEGGGTIQAGADAASAVAMVVSGILFTTGSS